MFLRCPRGAKNLTVSKNVSKCCFQNVFFLSCSVNSIFAQNKFFIICNGRGVMYKKIENQ